MPSISKIHSILELLRENYKTGLTNKEISITLKMPQSTCYRILSSLKDAGFVQKKPDDIAYILGHLHLRYAQSLLLGMEENNIVAPYLEELHQKTGRTAVFTRLSGDHCVVVVVHGSVNTRISVGIGEIMPFHCTAGGKVILAFMPGKQREKMLSRMDYKTSTQSTITDPGILRNNLISIYRTGTAYNQGELNQGINSMATPLFDRDSRIFGALVLVGTTLDLPLEILRSYSGLFHSKGSQITGDLGGRYPSWIQDYE